MEPATKPVLAVFRIDVAAPPLEIVGETAFSRLRFRNMTF
jgi:hypothetical protein